MRHFFCLICFLTLALYASAGHAQDQQIEIIFDASGSMNDLSGSTTKLDAAKQALIEIAGQITPGANVGLRIFGTTAIQGNISESCTDSILMIPIGPFQKERMAEAVRPLKSYGMTALGYSLEEAGEDFTPAPEIKKSIILISDGEETCGKDPIVVVQNLKAKGIDFKIHAIGFAASEAAKGQLKKLAEVSDGTYREAEQAVDLKRSLEEVVKKETLLTIQRDAGPSLIDASEGAKIVSSSTQEFAKVIDGSEESIATAYPDQEVIFSFKDNQPALVEKFLVPVFKVDDYNPGKMTVSGSVDSPELGFFPMADINVQNKVFFGQVYQEFQINPPAAVRYLKVTVGPGTGGGHSYHTEWKVSGKLLSEAEFAEAVKKMPAREMNILAVEYGGKLVAASNMKLANLIDGKSNGTGQAAEIKPGEEAIFEFKDGKTALIAKVAVPVFEASQYNCKTIEFYTSNTTPTGQYEKIGSFETMNMVFAGSPFQEYQFDKPVKAKYLKIKVVDTYGMYYCKMAELQVFGKQE